MLGAMAKSQIETVPSVCPHDCTSTCALEVERLDLHTIGRVRGSHRNTYTRGVICEKVGRYAERVHHPDRLLYPLRRVGPKGSGRSTNEESLVGSAARGCIKGHPGQARRKSWIRIAGATDNPDY